MLSIDVCFVRIIYFHSSWQTLFFFIWLSVWIALYIRVTRCLVKRSTYIARISKRQLKKCQMWFHWKYQDLLWIRLITFVARVKYVQVYVILIHVHTCIPVCVSVQCWLNFKMSLTTLKKISYKSRNYTFLIPRSCRKFRGLSIGWIINLHRRGRKTSEGTNERTNSEAARFNNRGDRMLIAIGTFVGLDTRASNVVAIIREQWCSNRSLFICSASRGSS